MFSRLFYPPYNMFQNCFKPLIYYFTALLALHLQYFGPLGTVQSVTRLKIFRQMSFCVPESRHEPERTVFTVRAPRLWNNLPRAIRLPQSHYISNHLLKYIFIREFMLILLLLFYLNCLFMSFILRYRNLFCCKIKLFYD